MFRNVDKTEGQLNEERKSDYIFEWDFYSAITICIGWESATVRAAVCVECDNKCLSRVSVSPSSTAGDDSLRRSRSTVTPNQRPSKLGFMAVPTSPNASFLSIRL